MTCNCYFANKIHTQRYNSSVCIFNTSHTFVSGSDKTGNGENAQSAIILVVWPARPSQQALRGEEGKGRLAYLVISSHLALTNRKVEAGNKQ